MTEHDFICLKMCLVVFAADWDAMKPKTDMECSLGYDGNGVAPACLPGTSSVEREAEAFGTWLAVILDQICHK